MKNEEDRAARNLRLLKNLMDASGDLWRAVKFKADYGKTYWVGSPARPYEEVVQNAVERTGLALREAGAIHLDEIWDDMEFVLCAKCSISNDAMLCEACKHNEKAISNLRLLLKRHESTGPV